MDKSLKQELDRIFSNKENTVLDIGPGYKDYLNDLGFEDIKRDIIEIDNEIIEFQRKLSNVNSIYQINFSKDDLNDKLPKYDLILIFEVIEHIERPHIVFEKLRNLLSPGGIILGSVPTKFSERIMFRINKKYNTGTNYPHVNFFTKKGLRNLVHHTPNLKIERLDTINLDYLFYHVFLNLFTSGYNISDGKTSNYFSKITYIFFISLPKKLGLKKPITFSIGRNYFFRIIKDD